MPDRVSVWRRFLNRSGPRAPVVEEFILEVNKAPENQKLRNSPLIGLQRSRNGDPAPQSLVQIKFRLTLPVDTYRKLTNLTKDKEGKTSTHSASTVSSIAKVPLIGNPGIRTLRSRGPHYQLVVFRRAFPNLW